MPDGQDTMKTDPDVQPVIDNPRLPLMTDTPPRPRPIKGRVVRMVEEPQPDEGTTGRMSAFRKSPPARVPRVRPDQKEAKVTRAAAAGQGEGYVRLRLRVTDGVVSIVGAQAVEGPLVEPKLQGTLAYEVTVGRRRVAAGGIPDIAEQRSFPDPNARGEKRGHHVEELTTFEVTVRVPKERVSAAQLPRLGISLFKVKEELAEPRVERLAAAPIGAQFERELREVGSMKGVKLDGLDRSVARQVRAAFK